jgi:glycosyltransferase involved in cell wall biosynthesis
MTEEKSMRKQVHDEPTFWMNVTTSSKWNRSPVGIVRVEQEIRRHLCRILQGRLQTIMLEEGRFVLENRESASQATNLDDFWPEPSYGSAADLFDPITIFDPVGSRPKLRSLSPKVPDFGHRDVLVTIGLDWDYPELHTEIRRCAQAYNLTVIGCCYDLIPIRFPQYCVGDVASWCKEYLIEMCWSSDGILCISENTRRDYADLAERIGLPPRPLEVIRLGSSLPSQSESPVLSKNVEQILSGRFFLFVSTIERRKNHEVLYRAYHLIRQEHPEADLPKLVFVGMEGWGVAELMSDIRLDPLTKDDIVVLPHVSDGELLRLYADCMVFLYPSLYEGWGLPVAEALQLGRPVLASAVGSVPEVGGELVRYLDPWSPREWADELLKIANGDVDLDSWSRKIATDFVPYEWSSAAETLIRLANERRGAKSSRRVLEPGYDLSTFNGVHYGDKIIYEGRQGIVCHGPYIALADGTYDVIIDLDWLQRASGLIRFKAVHRLGEACLATKEIKTSSLRPGRHRIILPMKAPKHVEDFELACEIDCVSGVKLSIDKIEITRVETEISPSVASRVA